MMHPLVAKHAIADQNERFPGRTPRQAFVATILMRIDRADDRWPSEAPLRAALIETMIRIATDEWQGTADYAFAKDDLVALLELYGSEALRELQDFGNRFRSAYAETVIARHMAKSAIEDVIRQRLPACPVMQTPASECCSNASRSCPSNVGSARWS